MIAKTNVRDWQQTPPVASFLAESKALLISATSMPNDSYKTKSTTQD